MILAAGYGKRMRPLTNALPKSLVEIKGRTLLDRILDHLEQAGVTRVVVNAHHLGDQIRKHLAARPRPQIEIVFEETLLETGGGVAAVLNGFSCVPFFVVNGDVLWFDGPECTLRSMAAAWDDARMDALLLLQPVTRILGYAGRGDYMMDQLGQLRRRKNWEVAPHVFAGVQILHPRLFRQAPEGAFSLNLLYDQAEREGRLYGRVHGGEWFHIGTPENLAGAEDRLAGNPCNFFQF